VKLDDKTLEEVNYLYCHGAISREGAEEYVQKWNDSGKHITTAEVHTIGIVNK
jgi:hypothetical protein